MSKREIVYEPPSPDVLEHFAHEVCREMGDDYTHYEIEQGLADFMKTVARICADNLNRKQSGEFDSGIE